MTAAKVMSDRFKVSSLWATRLRGHRVSVPTVFRRTALPTGFLVEEIWRELARHYLKHSALELNEPAFRLGCEDANPFFHAFQDWEGTAPGEWRMKHRAVEPKVLGPSIFVSV